MNDKGFWAGAVVIALIALSLLGGCGFAFQQNVLKTSEATITVEDKERIAEDGDGKWMVFAEDGETYEVTDSLFQGLNESTDRYRDLEVGKTYDCVVIGVRWRFFSTYKNIKDCEEVAPR